MYIFIAIYIFQLWRSASDRSVKVISIGKQSGRKWFCW